MGSDALGDIDRGSDNEMSTGVVSELDLPRELDRVAESYAHDVQNGDLPAHYAELRLAVLRIIFNHAAGEIGYALAKVRLCIVYIAYMFRYQRDQRLGILCVFLAALSIVQGYVLKCLTFGILTAATMLIFGLAIHIGHAVHAVRKQFPLLRRRGEEFAIWFARVSE